MPPLSAGILLYRGNATAREVFLVHPGGPYWARRDEGAWAVPKGLVESGEDAFACAKREFREETGFDIKGEGREIGIFRQPSGKRVRVWAVEGDCDPEKLRSNLFEMEWPPKSGRRQSFPEVDRGGWFDRDGVIRKIIKGQRPIIDAFFQS